MDNLKRQVRQAQRRLVLQQFLSVMLWSVLAALIVAAVGVAIPKIWHVNVETVSWTWGWIGGSVVAAVLVAIGITWYQGDSKLDAAIEIDRRYGLKERVSSCLSLSDMERESEAGQALTRDAVQRVAQVDIRQAFRISPGRFAWLPALAALLVFGLTFLSDAQPEATAKTDASTEAIRKQVQTSAEQLKKKIEERRKAAMAKGLEDATNLFEKIEQGVDNVANRKDVDRKQAMVKLNDLKKEIEARQQSLGGRDELRKQLNQLKDVKQGPADRVAKAMQQGDFGAALKEVQKIQEQLANDEMSDEDKKKLQEQMEQMKQRLEDMVAAHNQAKDDLQDQIQKRLEQGDRVGAEKLQQQLDQLNQQTKQMDKLGQLAQQFANAAESLESGNSQQASMQLSDLAGDLDQLVQDLSELEMLEDALEQIASAKDSMGCASCQGMGCTQCQGMGMGMGSGNGNGMGMGDGQGRGDRPEEETNTGFYESQVRAKPEGGKGVASGIAFGPNKVHDAREQLKAEILQSQQSNDDPLTGQRLPKAQRNLAREYFDAFREGE